jgi:hypothetical protein
MLEESCLGTMMVRKRRLSRKKVNGKERGI